MTTAASTLRRNQIAVVRIAAVAQGLALVCVPTLSSVLTESRGFALSQTAYGALFVPQSILAVVFSLAGGGLTRRLGMKRMLVTGLAANTLSMALLTSTAALHGSGKPQIFGLLLSATACLGFGFAIVTPALDVLAGAFAPPNATDRAVLIVNALLGAAAALAPLLLTVFVGFGLWWGLPLVAGTAMALLCTASTRLPFDVAGRQHAVDFWLTTEDLPMPDNRVTLEGDGTVRLAYTPNNDVPKNLLYAHLKSLLGKLGLHPDVLIPRTLYMKSDVGVAGVAHQAGTARFGSDPAMSVLDTNCKAHELDNLYVVDTSFFPSIGAVNPGLTAMANALRVGDHLLERLGVPH